LLNDALCFSRGRNIQSNNQARSWIERHVLSLIVSSDCAPRFNSQE
jgi:hypothetical protein